MAIVEHAGQIACDGFRAESPRGLLGFVEETWLGPDDRPAAFALRLLDGRRGLLLAGDLDAIVPERERVLVREGARVLELGAPHLVRVEDGGPLAASWETTGELLEPLKPPGAEGSEPSIGRTLMILFPGLVLLVALEITLAFAVAYLVTGRAY